MTEKQIQQLVTGLFTSGLRGEEAHRLVLTSKDGRDLGGWCRQAIVDRIRAALAGSEKGAPQG